MKNKLLALITVLAFLACNPGNILLPKGVAKTSTTGGQTGTTGGQTGTTGDQTGTTGDQTSTTGGQTGTTGDQTGTTGVQTGTTGGQTGTTGDQTGTTGVQTGTTGGQTGTTGVQTGTTGDQTGTTGDQTGTTGDQTSTTGVQTGTTGGQTGTTGDQTGTTGDQTSTTGDQTSTTGDQTSTTGDQTSTTGDQTSTTGDQTSTTGDQTSTTGLIQTKEELIKKLKETAKKIVDQVGKERSNLNNIESPTQSGIKYKVFSSNSRYTDEDRRKFYSSLEYDEKRIRDFAKILNKISDYGAREYDLLVGSIVSMGYWTIQRLFEATYENINEREHRLAQLKEEDIRTIESELEKMHKIKSKWLETIDAIILSYEKNEDGINSNVKKLIDHLQTKYFKHSTFLPDERAAMLKARSRIYDDFLHDLPLWELWKD
ncbi:complement regulator-acquiring protein [Borrelia sp. RT5S]|uniref:complement regulator-acquiring protein n=1 Tax=Borrelia sp. RT5S TaxID=2898581 RepID=UPI001E2AD437|nr:complement regulator-acquiring protein [Borrelia sp. RT5S]UGQ16501.1 complement regulator-acquiring protein [Borrelia sp. RT5S]